MRKSIDSTATTCVVVGLALALLAGCSQPEKPSELEQLEKILGAEGANEVKEYPNAADYYRKSRKLRRAALDALDDRDVERARHYAIRGKIAYQTAEAWRDILKSKDGFESINQKVKESNKKVEKLEQERNKLRAKVQDLLQKKNELERQRAKDRRERLKAKKKKEGEDSEEARKLEAQNKLDDARSARQEALKVNANEYAKATFNRAKNQLKSARSMLDSSPSDAVSTADNAIETFQKAAEEAKPKYEEGQAKKNPMKRLSSLKEKLSFNYGDSNVESVQRGVTVVFPGLFSKGSDAVPGSKQSQLDTVVELAKKFDEFKVRVEGFTRKGDPTENLTLSQTRASTVRDYLKNQGISSNRLERNGRGQAQIRYPDDPAKNDRVEITFKLKN